MQAGVLAAALEKIRVPTQPWFSLTERCYGMSAAKNLGVEQVLAAIFDLAPVGEPLYSGDHYTDQEPEFRIAEIIREQAFLRLREEVPHAVTVEIADLEVRQNPAAPGKTGLWVRAFLCVQSESQKGIVIGKGAAVIRAIRLAAAKNLRKIFFCPVELDLQVKVR
jgi:GTP-binding protein Era